MIRPYEGRDLRPGIDRRTIEVGTRSSGPTRQVRCLLPAPGVRRRPRHRGPWLLGEGPEATRYGATPSSHPVEGSRSRRRGEVGPVDSLDPRPGRTARRVQGARRRVGFGRGASRYVDGGGRMVVGMLGVVAKWEREVIVERITGALAVKGKRGERRSRFAPYGYRFEGDKVVPDKAAQAVIRYARSLRSRGASYAAVADALNRRGYRTNADRPHSPMSAYRLITSKRQPVGA